MSDVQNDRVATLAADDALDLAGMLLALAAEEATTIAERVLVADALMRYAEWGDGDDDE